MRCILPKNILVQIDRTTKLLFETIGLKKLIKPKSVGEISFTDPHSLMVHKATVVVSPKKSKGWHAAADCVQHNDGSATITFYYPYKLWRKMPTKRQLRCSLRDSLVHEMSHVLDPRPWDIQLKSHAKLYTSRQHNWLQYYADPCEFDAFCNEIELAALKQLQNKCHCSATYQRWMKLLKSPVVPTNKEFLRLVSSPFHQEVFCAWLACDYEQNTLCVRRFKKKMYNALSTTVPKRKCCENFNS
jgi:hypothetical protein